MPNNHIELLLIKFIMYLPKVIAAFMGTLFALVLSGDIGKDGKLNLSAMVFVKFGISVTISLFGGEWFIEHYQLTEHSAMYQGAVMLGFAVFGMLLIGVAYQSLALMQGKPISDVVKEIKQAFLAIFK